MKHPPSQHRRSVQRPGFPERRPRASEFARPRHAVRPVCTADLVRPVRPVTKKRNGVWKTIAFAVGPLLWAADAMDVVSLLEGGVNEIMTRGIYDDKAVGELERYAAWGGAVDVQPAELNDFYALPMGLERISDSVVAVRGYLPDHNLNLQMALAYEVPSVGDSQMFVEMTAPAQNGGEFIGCFYINHGRFQTNLSFEELLGEEIAKMRKPASDGAVPMCEHAHGGRLVATIAAR